MIKIPRRKKAFKEISDNLVNGIIGGNDQKGEDNVIRVGVPIEAQENNSSERGEDSDKLDEGNVRVDNEGDSDNSVHESVFTEAKASDKLNGGDDNGGIYTSEFRTGLSVETGHPTVESRIEEVSDNLTDGDIDKIRMGLPLESTEQEEQDHLAVRKQSGSDNLNVNNKRRARRNSKASRHPSGSDNFRVGIPAQTVQDNIQEEWQSDNLNDRDNSRNDTEETEGISGADDDTDIRDGIFTTTTEPTEQMGNESDNLDEQESEINSDRVAKSVQFPSRLPAETPLLEEGEGHVGDNSDVLTEESDNLSERVSDEDYKGISIRSGVSMEAESRGEGEGSESDILTEEDLENIVDDNSDNSTEEIEVLEPETVVESVEPVEEEPKKKDTLQELNEERKYQKKLDVIKFLKEYSKSISRSVDDVSAKLHIHPKTGRNYLNEYINIVKETVTNQTYPLGVLQHYNEGIDDDEKRLKFWHTDQLRDLVKRYSKYDINASLDPDRNKTLNSDHNDTFISKNSVAHSDDNLSLLGSGAPPQQQQQQLVQPMGNDIYNDIDNIHDGITSLQLIRFGLARVFGQQARTKIGEMMGTNVTPYLMDEQKMHKLLSMFGVSEKRCADFIDWIKTNAKYVSHPEGFLSYGASPTGGPSMGIPTSNYSAGVPNGNGTPDLMTDYYYKIGVYQSGFPPTHPVNVEALREYKQQEAENKQMKSLDQKINMYVRTKMLDAFDGSGGKNGQGNSLFSPEMMLMMGMAEYRQVRDENGNVTWTLTPKMLGGPQGMQGSANPTDQMTGMMAMMKEMMGFMASMQKTNTDPMQQNFMGTVMTALASKLTEQPQSKIQEVVGIAEMLQKLKGPENINANMGAITDPDVIIKTKRMDLDKEFGMRRLDLQEKELQLQRDRLQMQDKEANQNLQTLLEGIQSFAPMVVNMVQQFIMGNKGSAAAVGGAPMPQQPPQQNPADLILKMEYQKQQQRMAEERERKQREWEEEMRRKNETERMYQSYQPQPQPRPEAERVVIKEVPVKVERHQEEEYDESSFTPYTPQEIEAALEKVEKNIRKLEAYKATASNVLQNKLLNGDSEIDIEPIPEQPRVNGAVQLVPREEKPKQQNVGEMLDNYPEGMMDPDFDGIEREEEVEIVTGDDEHANIVSDVGDKNEAEDVEI